MTAVAQESASVQARATQYHRASYQEIAAGVDRMMAWLLALEWIGMVCVAYWRSPFTWEGTLRHWNPHFVAALLAGPAFICPCMAVALLYPGRQFTRHCVAVAQMLVSVLLIDVTGGRIETHFHVFGSLAFLAFYRDWRVLITASAVAGLDHIVRGFWWPQTVYGVITVSPYRWLEHVWWVLFEDFFLFVAICKSTDESKEVARAKSLLHQGAYHDVLTGLANRRQLSESFTASVDRDPSEPHAVLFVDLDRFKQVNDVHGHTVGDKLLLQVAARLTDGLTPGATLARIGGDEFIIVLNGESSTRSRQIGSALLKSLTAPFSVEGYELMLSATIGIALYPEHGLELAILQERADQAMYSAKAGGRNQVQVFSEEDAGKKGKLEEIARDLFEAHSKNQLHLDFQPLMNSAGEVLKFETLLRWNHPKYGAVPPSEFVPLAERFGLILTIGDWVLSEACRHCRSWQKKHSSPVGVTVNISALQLEHPGFASRVEEILREIGLKPGLLTIELTESTVRGNAQQVREHLLQLRKSGISVALDDFGTGYSSLSYLSDLPADSIKLDRSFVQHEFGSAAGVAQSVIEMAHKIGLRVVAEGVESQAEADWLLSLKCDELQGYKFSRPIPSVQVLQYLAERLAATRDYEQEAIAC